MYLEYNRNLTPRARELRKAMTPWERRLWYDFLCTLRPRFLRQKPISSYIADFYCSACRLVVELDGSQHFEPEAQEYDRIRTVFLENMGLTVLRFTNLDVEKNFEEVCQHILMTMTQVEESH